MRRFSFLVPILVTALAAAGCNLQADDANPAEANRPSPSAVREQVRAEWERELRRGAVQHPERRFANLPPGLLRARLRDAAARYRFTVVELEILRPSQAAPRVVVRTADATALSLATRDILRLIDPKKRTNDDRTGWAYEGFYFEARDRTDSPFLIVHNFWRGDSRGGGQWAARDDLYPFAHSSQMRLMD
jgi:hypothetical protein